jgi:hypothetical protein
MKDLNFFKMKDSVYIREVRNKDEVLEGLGKCDGFLIRGSEKVARSIIASLKDKKFCGARNSVPSKVGAGAPFSSGKVGIYGGDDAFNRRVIESLKIDYLVSPEANAKFDNLKQRDSGLNHVVAKIAAEKGIKIVIDMREISRLEETHNSVPSKLGTKVPFSSGKEKALRLSKVMQNVRVCRKVGCSIGIASLGRRKGEVVDEKGRKSFGVTLGMSSGEVRDCCSF